MTIQKTRVCFTVSVMLSEDDGLLSLKQDLDDEGNDDSLWRKKDICVQYIILSPNNG